jgi:subtilisin family serine protease
VAILHQQGARRLVKSYKRLGNLQVVQLSANEKVADAVASYRASGLVEIAEPDYPLKALAAPNDPEYLDGNQWALHNTGLGGGNLNADIHATAGWDTMHDASNVVVAVIDSGIRYTHQDLAGNMWTNQREIAGNGIDDDQNGFVDDVHGFDAITNSGDPMDDNGHGTHVAGIIGAVGNNGVGTAGVAWKVQLMACKFLDSAGNGDTSDAIECIDYAVQNGAQIINASWGGPDNSRALQSAIASARDAGVIFVTAAGNDAVNIDVSPNYPAAYDLANMITVCATTRYDTFDSSYSNYSPTKVHVGAPGTLIYSTWDSTDKSYAYESGTSMASPMVAGVCALLKARFPNENAAEIIQRVIDSADPLPSLQGKCLSGGRVNLAKALGPSVAPDFTSSALAGEPPLSISFTNNTWGEFTNLTWDFGDGTPVVAALNPKHVYLYPGTFTVSLSATDRNGITQVLQRQAHVEPNYTESPETYHWIDPTSMTQLLMAQNNATSQPLPFGFRFFNDVETNLYISGNGWISFAGDGLEVTTPDQFPNTNAPNAVIAAYWDDLNLAAGGEVYFGITGEAPQRKAVISWVNVPRAGSFTTVLTFQMVLEESTGDVVLQYAEVHAEKSKGGGKAASVGLEDASGEMGVSFEYLGKPTILSDGTALRFSPKQFPYLKVSSAPSLEFNETNGLSTLITNLVTLSNPGNFPVQWSTESDVPWLTISPESGILAAGEEIEVAVTTSGLAATLVSGDYSGNLRFTAGSNGGGGLVPVNLSLIEVPQPVMEITPPSAIAFSGGVGGPFSPLEYSVTVKNSGAGDLRWQGTSSENWATLTPASSELPPGAETNVVVTLSVEATQLGSGDYHAALQFVNTENGSGNGSYDVTLEIRGEIKPSSASVENGQFTGVFSVPEAGSYTIEYSSDLRTWTVLQSVEATSGLVDFTAPINLSTMRFFRARAF